MISISDEGKFGGVRKWLIIIQRATGFLFLFYFMKSFKFQCLLGLNGQSIEIWKSVLGSNLQTDATEKKLRVWLIELEIF